jgi:hypothetical protein
MEFYEARLGFEEAGDELWLAELLGQLNRA